MQYAHVRSQAEYFLFRWKILQKLADDQCSPITKGSIIYIKHMYNFLSWKWIDQKFDVKWKYLLSFIFTHTVFLLCSHVFETFGLHYYAVCLLFEYHTQGDLQRSMCIDTSKTQG